MFSYGRNVTAHTSRRYAALLREWEERKTAAISQNGHKSVIGER